MPPRRQPPGRRLDASLAGIALEDWRFSFNNEIDYDVQSGTFVVRAGDANTPGIVAQGLADGAVHQFNLSLGHNAQGHINPTAGTWNLHHVEGDSSGTLVVHLAGDIHDLTP